MGQALAVQVQGQGVVSADNLNTYLQGADNAAALRGFVGAAADGVTVQVYMRGTVTPGDGGQGYFYWNPTGTAPDDNGVTTIVPSGAPTGEWTRLGAGGGGGGNVTGPGSSNNGFIPQWNGSGGNVLSSGLPVGVSGANTILETEPTGFVSVSVFPPLASNVGSFTNSNITVNENGFVTAASNGSTSTGPFTSKFTSTGNAVPVTAVLSVAHGLGVVPFGIQVTLVNVTSNLGYTAGQEVELSTATQEVNSYTIALYKDVTSVYLGTSDIIYIPTASGGAAVPITAADWTVTVRAWI
jgi:hypothetical protein